jgi:glyceraldehyde-3-phosphate dehydrogenase (ferredoxin)
MPPVFSQRAVSLDAASGRFEVTFVEAEDCLGPVDFGHREFLERDGTVIGGGALAGGIVPGSNRLIVTGRSPLWEGFYISTMGGAALIFDDVGVNYLSIQGRRPRPSIMRLSGGADGTVSVEFEEIDPAAIFAGYKGLFGLYALQHHVCDRWRRTFERTPRVLATGPAALATNMGAIASAPLVKDGPGFVDCWAGRGGMGSRLAQEHNILAIIYGGTFVDRDFRDRTRADQMFMEHYGKKMVLQDSAVTKKYRFDPTIGSGGTFGSNYSHLKNLMYSHNYSSVYRTDEERLALWEKGVHQHYLRQFNAETALPKNFEICGEPCVAVCKKMHGRYKKDYEPYQTMGPNSGIFDQRAAERLVYRADELGYDSIQIGGVISWVMEVLHRKILSPAQLGLSRVPRWDVDGLGVVADSMHNAELGVQIVDRLTFDPSWELFRRSIRPAARELDRLHGTRTVDLAVYLAHGDSGSMVPNQYWIPGMLSPMAIMGKYFCYYGYDYHPPFELGRKNAERFVMELMIDNFGVCRFHRGWAEEFMGEIVNEHFQVKVDWATHTKKRAAALQASHRSHPWESARVRDIIRTYLEKAAREGKPYDDLDGWLARWKMDPDGAALSYWNEILRGVRAGLGLSDAPRA